MLLFIDWKMLFMLTQIFKQNKWKIISIYLVVIVETIVFSLIPWFCGLALDSLLVGDSQKFKQYVAFLTFGVVLGIFRRMIDTRIFAIVWRDIAVKTVSSLMEKKIESAKIISRSGLLNRFVDFFEYNLPAFVRSNIRVITSISMIYVVVGHIVWIVVGLCILALVFGCYMVVLRKKVDHETQDIEDKVNEVIQKSNKNNLWDCYDKRSNCYIKWSDFEAWSWGLQDITGIISEVIVVLALVGNNATTGMLLATMNYVWQSHNNFYGIQLFFGNLKEIEVAEERLKYSK